MDLRPKVDSEVSIYHMCVRPENSLPPSQEYVSLTRTMTCLRRPVTERKRTFSQNATHLTVDHSVRRHKQLLVLFRKPRRYEAVSFSRRTLCNHSAQHTGQEHISSSESVLVTTRTPSKLHHEFLTTDVGQGLVVWLAFVI